MQKFKKHVLDTIINNCTSAEMEFLLYISQFQDDNGRVKHIQGQNVCLYIKRCKASYYNVLSSLQNKGIIKVYGAFRKDKIVKIIGNDFSDKNFSKDKGYVSVKYSFLQGAEFRQHTKNVQRLILKFLRLQRNDKDSYFRVRVETVMRWIDLKSRRILDTYLESLKKYFLIIIEDNIISFKLRPVDMYDLYRYESTDNYKKLNHRIQAICRIYKISYNRRSLRDLIYMITHTHKYKTREIFNAFRISAKQYHCIEVKFINHMVSKAS